MDDVTQPWKTGSRSIVALIYQFITASSGMHRVSCALFYVESGSSPSVNLRSRIFHNVFLMNDQTIQQLSRNALLTLSTVISKQIHP
jgi:hypothetical protein